VVPRQHAQAWASRTVDIFWALEPEASPFGAAMPAGHGLSAVLPTTDGDGPTGWAGHSHVTIRLRDMDTNKWAHVLHRPAIWVMLITALLVVPSGRVGSECLFYVGAVARTDPVVTWQNMT
jgi:hypothetical protein